MEAVQWSVWLLPRHLRVRTCVSTLRRHSGRNKRRAPPQDNGLREKAPSLTCNPADPRRQSTTKRPHRTIHRSLAVEIELHYGGTSCQRRQGTLVRSWLAAIITRRGPRIEADRDATDDAANHTTSDM